MALQILLETAVEVTGLKSTQSESIFDGQGITTVLLPYSIVLINVSIWDYASTIYHNNLFEQFSFSPDYQSKPWFFYVLCTYSYIYIYMYAHTYTYT
jgi:hypothetical protein